MHDARISDKIQGLNPSVSSAWSVQNFVSNNWEPAPRAPEDSEIERGQRSGWKDVSALQDLKNFTCRTHRPPRSRVTMAEGSSS
jgi:hypothetical protein